MHGGQGYGKNAGQGYGQGKSAYHHHWAKKAAAWGSRG